jgi:hypothetical protein
MAHATYGRREIYLYRVLVGEPEYRDYLENLGVDRSIILKRILK